LSLTRDVSLVERMSDKFSRNALKEATLEGVRWVSLGRGVTECLTLASAVTLAHLVPPSQFGRLAVTVIVSELAVSLAQESIGTAIVQRKVVTKRHLESAALIGLTAGIVLTLCTLFLLPFAATPLFGSETSSLFQLYSPAFVLAGLRVVPQALIQRALDFRRTSIFEMAATFVTAVTSVALAAFVGLDAEAYILGSLAGTALSTVLYLASVPRALPRWHRTEMRELLRFGVPAGLGGAAWVGYRNIDYAILGAVLTPALVGFYYRAFTVGVEYEQKISGIVNRMVFPIYSRTENASHMRDVRARIVRVNATLIFPLLAFFVSVAPVLVPFAFGARWDPAVLPAQILVIAGLAAMLNAGTGPLVMASGRPRVMLLVNTIMLITYASTVYLAAHLGLTEVCIAVAAFQVTALVCSFQFVLRPLVGVSLGQLGKDIAPATVASVVLLAAAMPLTSLMEGAGVPAPLILAAAALVAAPIYLAVVRQFFPGAWSDIALLLSRLLRRRSPRPAAAPLSLAESPAAQ
jgi:O-antigen/teichoic acid export membrane protein